MPVVESPSGGTVTAPGTFNESVSRMKSPSTHLDNSSSRERGSTMLETVVALVILTIGVMGVMGLLTVAVTQNWNQGDRSTRTTEYAQDKMEQLLALNFTDGSSDTTVYPTASTGGTGLGGTM